MLVEQKIAIITGAASGIGLGAARRLARAGMVVVLVDIAAEQLKQAVADFNGQGLSAVSVVSDVSNFQKAHEQVRQIIDIYGRVDVLINNAGISQPKSFLELSEADWDRTLAVNLKGFFNWTRACAPIMQAQKSGRIINVSSVSAHTGGAPSAVSKSAYSASKAGVLGLTRGLAKELAPHVFVNAVCPGAIMTDLTRQLFTRDLESIQQSIPLQRIGTPDDVAVVIEFLATMEPCFMTGEIIDVDGGQWVN